MTLSAILDQAPKARTTSRSRVAQRAVMLLVVALAVLLPSFVYPVFLMKVACYAMLALSFNLLLGFGGLLSFGHAAYFGLASYVSAYSAKHLGVTPEIAILAGTGAAVLLAVPFGALSIRRQGIYFAMVTLALAQMVFFFCIQATGFTGGEDGIQAVPRGQLFGLIDLADDRNLYIFVAVIFIGVLALIYRIIHSPYGQALRAIRDNEMRAASLGFKPDRLKLQAFVISAGIAGLGGATKAIVFQLATLNDVHWSMSGEAVLMTMIGGLGSVFGPVIGAAIILSIQNYLAHLEAWVSVIHGLVFIVVVLAFRRGVIGLPERLLKVKL